METAIRRRLFRPATDTVDATGKAGQRGWSRVTEISRSPANDATPANSATRHRRVTCREIRDADLEAVARLLTRGFADHDQTFWNQALDRLSRHNAPSGFPRFGYLLESDGQLVGCLLLIFTKLHHTVDGREPIRCSVSSWFTDPEFRFYSSMMVARALRFKNVTYFNITPHPGTYGALHAQGYTRYCEGRFICIPLLRQPRSNAVVRAVLPHETTIEGLSEPELRLLREHAEYGCLSVVCTHENNIVPFVFLRTRLVPGIRSAYLAYCRDVADFTRFAGPLGKFLRRQGIMFAEVDASGAIPGLGGIYIGGAPKYFKGDSMPQLGDLSYSERVMFGF